MTGEFRAALDHYLLRLKAREPMAMYRVGDGELMLSRGVEVGENTQANRVDRWQAPGRLTALGRDLNTVLDTQEQCFHFGIPCTCCNAQGSAELKARITRAPIFPANLWINSNYKHFVAFMREQMGDLPVSLLMNYRGDEWKLPFRVQRRLSVPDDCVNYYEKNKYAILSAVRDFARSTRFELIFVGAGPLSEILIFYMWNANPYNTYIDIGSAFDEFIYGVKTRPYMVSGTPYAERECVMA
jgi:hypothetical protein